MEEDSTGPKVPRIVYKIPGSPARLSTHVTNPEEGGREPGTVSGIQFQYADPVAACRAIEQNGGTVANEPWTMQRGTATIVRAVIADLDGNEFILSPAL